MLNKEFQLRRNQLLKKLGSDSIAIIFAAREHARNGKENYPFRQNSDFYYLTGFIEPDAIAVLTPNRSQGAFILFSHKKNPTKELWHGAYIGQDNACKEYGADQAFCIDTANKILPSLLSRHKKIYSNVDSDKYHYQKLITYLKKTATKNKILNLSNILDEMRLKKGRFELTMIRKAIEITTEGHLRAMKKCSPGMYEYELEAELHHECIRLGGRKMAYEPIVGGGVNACTLHYSKNDKKLKAGELVLIDAGTEYNHYSADVSRTLPISGKFTKKQRALYEIVLAAQMEVIKKIRPGISWHHLQTTAEQIITEGLVGMGLLKGQVANLIKKQACNPFFIHKVGHWLGLDIHDVGAYNILEPDMVLTIEPGIYIASQAIGIRIEDNILVTKNGCEVLTDSIPKSATEIEKIMQK